MANAQADERKPPRHQKRKEEREGALEKRSTHREKAPSSTPPPLRASWRAGIDDPWPWCV